MQLTLTTARVTDPVSLAECRQWLNFTAGITEDDEVLRTLIDEAYDFLERRTNRRMLGQTWTLTLDESEVGSVIRLPLVPLRSVSSIKTTDDDGNETTVTSTNYQVRGGENPRVVLTADGEWPDDMREYDSMAIACVCGYGGSVLPYVGFVPDNPNDPGENDLSAGGTFSGTARTYFEIEVDSIGAADTFKWRKITRNASSVKTIGAWTAGVDMTGAAQTLADGITVTFAEVVNHTEGDAWVVELFEELPDDIRLALKGLILYLYTTKGRGVTETVSGQLIGMPRVLDQMIDSLRVGAW